MRTLTLTPEQLAAIEAKLAGMHISKGLGDVGDACSVAAINLALSGRLTDNIPPCMSAVIGRWIIPIQDAMPDAMRNSTEWRRLLPLAAGTGRDPALERARLGLILDWMWGVVLPQLQPIANANGYGAEWAMMCKERTAEAADAAAAAAAEARVDAYAAARAAIWAAANDAAADLATVAAEAADAAIWAGNTAEAAAVATIRAAARAAANVADTAAFWIKFDPPGLLAKLINVEAAP